ncbi:MAG: AbrB/MazE/SpoVT family DNA-binding domain-containing protein [Propionibacteriaceae bacterium]|jgi:AbrB family looped-hinge helix DNA binding protein|nr:AbrB/MazE/SpoVT family DNA-binding domain-containing protein [Propionibacteriaceae bacterium]
MLVKVDASGRIMVPKTIRQAVGISPGLEVDVSVYGAGVQITPGPRTAALVRDQHGHLVAQGSGVLDDATMYALIDAGRR